MMTIVEKRLCDLTPYENNPRVNETAVNKVSESIRRYGFKVPLVIDKDGVIVCGHTRYLACKLLGLDVVPCVVADDLTDEQTKEFRLIDNKTSEFAFWDSDLLKGEIESLDEELLAEFEFPDFGVFEENSMEEVEEMFGDKTPAEKSDIAEKHIASERGAMKKLVIMVGVDKYDELVGYLKENAIRYK